MRGGILRAPRHCKANPAVWAGADFPIESSSLRLSACAASAVKPRRMSVTPAASPTFVVPGTGITRKTPDQPGENLGIVAAADPHPMTARDVDLNRPTRFSGASRRRSAVANRALDDLDRQEAGIRRRDGIRVWRKPRVTQPFEDDVRIQRVAPRHLRHGNTGRRRLETDRPLLLHGPEPLGSTRHRKAHSVRYPKRTLSDAPWTGQGGVPGRVWTPLCQGQGASDTLKLHHASTAGPSRPAASSPWIVSMSSRSAAGSIGASPGRSAAAAAPGPLATTHAATTVSLIITTPLCPDRRGQTARNAGSVSVVDFTPTHRAGRGTRSTTTAARCRGTSRSWAATP